MGNNTARKTRIRTIRDAIALLKQADSQTAVTYHLSASYATAVASNLSVRAKKFLSTMMNCLIT